MQAGAAATDANNKLLAEPLTLIHDSKSLENRQRKQSWMAALIYSRQRGFQRLRVILCIQISKTWSVLRSESVPCMIQHAADGTLDQVERGEASSGQVWIGRSGWHKKRNNLNWSRLLRHVLGPDPWWRQKSLLCATFVTSWSKEIFTLMTYFPARKKSFIWAIKYLM